MESVGVLAELEDRAGRQHVVRLATLEELRRLAFVLMTAFSFSPVNQFQRPKYQTFPGDTFYDYYLQLVDAFLDPTTRIYVSEDSYAPDEEKPVPKAFPKKHFCPGTGHKVIAGVAICRGLGRRKIGKKEQGLCPTARKWYVCSQARDKDSEAVISYVEQTKSAKEKFKGCDMSIATFVVHPSYWGRGHGTALAVVCTSAADNRKVKACVSATTMSKGILTRFGFKFEDLEVMCERPFPISLGVRLPSNTNG
ncbi:hypothetical protein K432DRAFT_307573 [Lepidopterella palustris CBS 459.81]|uniref:N-acetyltransferase domain-containing protein n=1 Tax=Lepidopterella palustris CBS 459.81 TaxID=1314670 RepID=A0A8E2JAX6_9PEZI|nr:hypothetical protein K432DRAFT_307573 [Lepidopterella palustris CBS 459.81]